MTLVCLESNDQHLIDLLGRIASHDNLAMQDFYDATNERLYAFTRRIVTDAWTAEEIVQDVYAHVWRNASSYSADRGAPVAWLRMMARSRALDTIRRLRRQTVIEIPRENAVSASKSTPELEYANSRRNAALNGVVTALPKLQEELIRMSFYEGFSHSEIADVTGLPLGTIKTRIRSALNTLRSSIPAEWRTEYARIA